MVVDPLAMRGVEIAQPSAETFARLRREGHRGDARPHRRPHRRGRALRCLKAALDVLTTAPEFDMVLAVVGSSARFHPEQAVQPIIDSANAAKPIAAFLVPEAPEALARLSEAGVPSFRTPEACADAIAAALCGARRSRRSRRRTGGSGRVLDEMEAYALLDRLGMPRTPAVALDTTITQAPALPFAYPVAVKVLSADIPHKTEAGGVALNVRDGDALMAAIKAMRETVEAAHRHHAGPRAGRADDLRHWRGADRLSRRPRGRPADHGGGRRRLHRNLSRPQPAPCAGRSRDRPCDDRRSEGFRDAEGFRGKPAGDLDALAKAIVALSRLALQNDPAIAEAEVNPLIVQADGVVAVDALI